MITLENPVGIPLFCLPPAYVMGFTFHLNFPAMINQASSYEC